MLSTVLFWISNNYMHETLQYHLIFLPSTGGARDVVGHVQVLQPARTGHHGGLGARPARADGQGAGRVHGGVRGP